MGLVLLFGGLAAAVIVGASSGGDDAATVSRAPKPATASPTPPPSPPPAAKPVKVALEGVSGFDPEGDGRENDESAPLATDGDPATYWPSETYTSFFKDGVGLLLDAGKSVRLSRVVVMTDTPEVAASIRVGAQPDGPFTSVSSTQRLSARTAFELRPRRARYVVVWIEDIPDGGAAHVNEATAQATG
jgi:hypothetical protein